MNLSCRRRIDSLSHLRSPLPAGKYWFSERSNIVFIGGFDHRPNVDAVQYFTKQIWPLIRAQLVDARMIVVGSRITDEVRALEDDASGIEIRGLSQISQAFSAGRSSDCRAVAVRGGNEG